MNCCVCCDCCWYGAAGRPNSCCFSRFCCCWVWYPWRLLWSWVDVDVAPALSGEATGPPALVPAPAPPVPASKGPRLLPATPAPISATAAAVPAPACRLGWCLFFFPSTAVAISKGSTLPPPMEDSVDDPVAAEVEVEAASLCCIEVEVTEGSRVGGPKLKLPPFVGEKDACGHCCCCCRC